MTTTNPIQNFFNPLKIGEKKKRRKRNGKGRGRILRYVNG
jgi:hypothetical protein